jgi:hypothetical protein
VNWKRAALAAGGAAAVALLLLRQTPPGASARPAEEARPRPAVADRRPDARPPLRPSRDVFAYADAAEPEEERAPVVPLVEAATPLPPPPPLAGEPAVDPLAPRLIGLVRKAAGLEAVLAIDGEVMVVKKGSRAGNYTVTAIDEDQGVRLQDAGGGELVLTPPPS